jgi:hypothetical protein
MLHTSSLPGTRPHRVACCPTGDAHGPWRFDRKRQPPGNIDSSGPHTRRYRFARGQPPRALDNPDSTSVEQPAGVGVLDDLFRLEDLGAVEDRERRGLARMPLVLRAGELYELVAAQSAALTEERQQAQWSWPAPIPSLTLRKVASFMATRCVP